MLEGRYDDIDKLTASLDANDPDVVAVKARAAIARGRYEQAETMLRGVPLAPTSDAALELGLLLQMLGRADAAHDAGARGAARQAQPRADGDRARRARAACARPVARRQRVLPARREPCADRPAINTGWGELFLQTEQNGEALKSFQAA